MSVTITDALRLASVYRFHEEASVVQALENAGFDSVNVVHRSQGEALVRVAVASATGQSVSGGRP
jgi:hypothetical protein